MNIAKSEIKKAFVERNPVLRPETGYKNLGVLELPC